MMLLNVHIDGKWRYGETPEEKTQAVSEAFEILAEKGSGGPDWRPGEIALFSFSETPYDDHTLPNNCLMVSINASSGYGGLIWFSTDDHPQRGGAWGKTWVSDNPEPPDFDPQVVSDPGYPLFHDPASTLPIAQVRQAVEEFNRIATGGRPECLSWIGGAISGQRDDRAPIIETVGDDEIDWDSLP
ncbi:Imm1 family immunity protein [Streptomyces sp. CBMA156]|uniref:Imm1 family immunity protein n=1 Tax=Streptomyces sp. CBMA156 TaxID=1930280 RepID=UPI0016620EC7|nr:Imm1 family immunity protein [Streptomyces sp. CBMA156]MBD0676161.1 hypothetical protein [Streptomyces sp. CBMA156]